MANGDEYPEAFREKSERASPDQNPASFNNQAFRKGRR